MRPAKRPRLEDSHADPNLFTEEMILRYLGTLPLDSVERVMNHAKEIITGHCSEVVSRVPKEVWLGIWTALRDRKDWTLEIDNLLSFGYVSPFHPSYRPSPFPSDNSFPSPSLLQAFSLFQVLPSYKSFPLQASPLTLCQDWKEWLELPQTTIQPHAFSSDPLPLLLTL